MRHLFTLLIGGAILAFLGWMGFLWGLDDLLQTTEEYTGSWMIDCLLLVGGFTLFILGLIVVYRGFDSPYRVMDENDRQAGKIAVSIVALIILSTTVFTPIVNGQDAITLGVVQDLSLAVSKDDYGNSPFTLDALVRSRLEGTEQKYGYPHVGLLYEYADLSGGTFQHFSVFAGYTFFLPAKFEGSLSLEFGFIERDGTNMTGGATADLSYPIFPWLDAIATTQGLIRTDLKDSPLRVSGLLGFRADIFDTTWERGKK